jgi:hypothetical protein
MYCKLQFKMFSTAPINTHGQGMVLHLPQQHSQAVSDKQAKPRAAQPCLHLFVTPVPTPYPQNNSNPTKLPETFIICKFSTSASRSNQHKPVTFSAHASPPKASHMQ